MKKLFFLIGFFCFFSIELYCQPTTNKGLIDSILNQFSTNLIRTLNNTNNSNIKLVYSDIETSYFADYINSQLIDSHFLISENNSLSYIDKILNLKISFSEFEIRYQSQDNGTYKRNIIFYIQCFKIDKNGEISLLIDQKTIYSDTLKAFELQNIEDPLYPFTKGKVPEKKSNFFDEILEPAIIISASVISIVLFFSVRSK